MNGAFATQQGNCSAFKSQIPYSCEKKPFISDFMPDAPAENKTENCCRGGLLSAWAIDPQKSSSSFDIIVGNLDINASIKSPLNPTLMAPGPGYTCSPFLDAKPSVSHAIGGKREVQVFRTWKSACTYSSFVANKAPNCCVSLSTFYNPTITRCPECSCGCKLGDKNAVSCISEGLPFPQSDSPKLENVVQCTDHMCPVQVHWHVKNNYREYWRVKLTVTNFRYGFNYSDWNVLVQHPGFKQPVITYSFNNKTLPTGVSEDGLGLFWGIPYYNDELLRADNKQLGSVTTDIILQKDLQSFTLRNGWALPRRIYFNGENCEMPPPDNFPMLPNGTSNYFRVSLRLLLLLLLMVILWS